MAVPLTPPALPLEILEEIVDFRAQLDGDPENWTHTARPWSAGMLALLSTSKQLRFCAIRHIFHDVHIYCGAYKRRMDRLRKLIVPGIAGLPLGSNAPLIKSLYIHTDDTSGIPNDKLSRFYQVSLLDAIRNKSPLCSLSLEAFMEYERPRPWDTFPPDFQRTVISFFRIPSLTRFKTRGICAIHGQIFRGASLHKLWIADSVSEYGHFTHPAANLPSIQNSHITSLVVHRSDLPNQLSLPNLQHLVVARLPSTFLNALWAIITSTWSNLISLEIDDDFNGRDCCTYSIPESINISLLPRLQVFKYWHVQKLFDAPSQPMVLPAIVFFRITGGVSALKHVEINVYFEKRADTKEELLSNVYRDPSWGTLDHFLSTCHFPNLAKVKITLQQSLTVSVTWRAQHREESRRNREVARDLHAEVESALRPSFSRLLQKSSVALEVNSIVHPFGA